MEEIFEAFKQISGEVWKNFKHHVNAYSSKNPEEFFENWFDDLQTMGNAYSFDMDKQDLTEEEKIKKASFIFYSYLATGLYDGIQAAIERGQDGRE